VGMKGWFDSIRVVVETVDFINDSVV